MLTMSLQSKCTTAVPSGSVLGKCTCSLLPAVLLLFPTIVLCKVGGGHARGKATWQVQGQDHKYGSEDAGSYMGITCKNPWLSNEPKIIKISQELGELWSKQCFDHNSLKSQPILMILGSFESHGFLWVIPVQLPGSHISDLDALKHRNARYIHRIL